MNKKGKYDKEWRKANPERVSKHFKKYWDKNKNERNRKRRDFYALNRKKMVEKTQKWQKVNPEKVKETRAIWRKNNPNYKKEFAKKYPEKFKAQVFKSLMWRIGVKMTYEEFNRILLEQNNVCAICGEKDFKKRLSVDHCHKTGKFRGLLCQTCNTSLGGFKDNVELLKSAIKYLTTKK
jgi:hypothetical protein